MTVDIMFIYFMWDLYMNNALTPDPFFGPDSLHSHSSGLA